MDKINEIEKVLRFIYYDPSHPASFSTAEKLFEASKEFIPTITLNDVKKWLSGELTYTLHKPIRRHFKRNPIIVEHIDQQWEADLVDMREFSKKNKNFNFILTIIDVLSKYAWAVPLKDKTQKSVVKAFEQIFKLGRFPKFIRTDQGKEFLNKEFKNLLEKYHIYHFTSKNQTIKCSIVERFNRTLKGKMYKYFTSKGTRIWYNILDKLVLAYNNTKHKTIKMTPTEAMDSTNSILFKNVYGFDSIEDLYSKNNKVNFKPADTVRKSYNPGPFDKSFYPNWTDKTFKIETMSKQPIKAMLNIKDEKEVREKQRFYPEELQKITENLYRIEKIIKSKKSKGKKQYFVKWIGYPNTYNSWVNDEDMVNLND